MDIQLEKLDLIKKLVETKDPTIINSIKKIFSKKKKDWWDDLSDEQKEEIKESERQIERGEFVSYEDLMKKYR
ncbi:hypothetical protein [Flavobacterium sp. ov086]|uniref:hypothetical protein n=1 Tax=Flavobacterium sp. ov086 TaxID=1761785 RepID=UPI000B6A2464|nr:hypothetical protein [Flavobacterium sp. ov086]SNR22968.1 hypothetical protein SAMN04487979_10181 [Flavobacterium sp. ov086]